jgi:type VI secretion system protein VasG
VAEVVAGWTGIPVGRMLREEVHTVLSLGERLRRRVVGQDGAIDVVAERICVSRADLRAPGTPVGVFLLVGPSGVGKTETALAVAEQLYGGERSVITINMSEYKEPHSLAALKGAPPGYVGYGKGGMLTEAVRRRPYSVVLLDEFEKAHRDVKQLFMGVFSTGILQDAVGREISFQHTIIFLTSNVGARLITTLCADAATRPGPAQLLVALEGELTSAFEQELYGRMTPVPYYPLDEETVRRVVALQLGRLRDRLRETHRAELEYGDEVIGELASQCQAALIGARVVDQILNRTLMPGIARELLGRMGAGQRVSRVKVHLDGKGTFRYGVS